MELCRGNDNDMYLSSIKTYLTFRKCDADVGVPESFTIVSPISTHADRVTSLLHLVYQTHLLFRTKSGVKKLIKVVQLYLFLLLSTVDRYEAETIIYLST